MSIKLNAQSGGSVALDAPTQTTNSEDKIYKLPIADGTAGQVLKTDGSGNLSWVTLPTPGITEVDLWRMNTGFQLSGSWAHISSGWERQDHSSAAKIGTGMSFSNGVFTFPSTGKWMILQQLQLYTGSHEMHYTQTRTRLSTDSGSNYTTIGYSIGGAASGGAYGSSQNTDFINVTNASTFRILWDAETGIGNESSNYIRGGTDDNFSTWTFIRLGDI